MIGRRLMSFVVAALCAGAAAQAASYASVLRRAERHAQVYDFDLVRADVVWSAAWLTPALRDARVVREAKLRRTDEASVDAALPDAWRTSGSNFFVTLFAPRDAQGDLAAVNALWTLELQDAAGRTSAPTTITAIKPTLLDRKLFPRLTPWSKAYYVHFAASAAPPAQLTLRGPTIASTLTWK